MSSKPKIAVIGLKGLPAFGGAATVGQNIIENLSGQFDFTVYSISSHTHLPTGKVNQYYQIVFRKILWGKSNVLKGLNTFYYYLRAVLHVLFMKNYDLVHLHHRDAIIFLPFLRMKYRVIVTTHQIYYVREKWSFIKWFFRLQEKYFLRFASHITCVSKEEKRLFLEKYKMEVEYIPNGVNLMPDVDADSTSTTPYILFSAGRIIPSKGLHQLLEALPKSKYPDFSLKVVGDLSQMQSYKASIQELSKICRVEFLGLIKNKAELFKIVKNAHIFVFPSTMEAMSMMLLETSSLKVPIIASDIQENKDVFNDSEVLFYKSEHVIDLTDKLNQALDNHVMMVEKAERAYQRVSQEYLWTNISKVYANRFNALCSLNQEKISYAAD